MAPLGGGAPFHSQVSLGGETGSCCPNLGKWLNKGLVPDIAFLSFLGVREQPLAKHCFFCRVFSAGEAEQHRKGPGASCALCTDADTLGLELERGGSEDGLSATSISRPFR